MLKNKRKTNESQEMKHRTRLCRRIVICPGGRGGDGGGERSESLGEK